MRRRFVLTLVAASLAVVVPRAQSASRHTLVVLSHSNHTVYEVEPETGAVIH